MRHSRARNWVKLSSWELSQIGSDYHLSKWMPNLVHLQSFRKINPGFTPSHMVMINIFAKPNPGGRYCVICVICNDKPVLYPFTKEIMPRFNPCQNHCLISSNKQWNRWVKVKNYTIKHCFNNRDKHVDMIHAQKSHEKLIGLTSGGCSPKLDQWLIIAQSTCKVRIG